MPEHTIGTRDEWQAARSELATDGSDFPCACAMALTEEQAREIPEVKELSESPPDWLQAWSRQVDADLKDWLRENPSYIACAREDGVVYHPYTVSAPDPFVAP